MPHPGVMQAQKFNSKSGNHMSRTTSAQLSKMTETVTTIDIQGKLPKVASGKVRDLFAVNDDTLLFVASDRISAYDVIMENVSDEMRDKKTKPPHGILKLKFDQC